LTGALPGLLQPWGILAFIVFASASLYAAHRWHRARPGRPPLHLEIGAIWLLALLCGGFFWRVLTERDIYMPAGGGDLAALYFPTYGHVAEQIKAGNLPLWNPHAYSGMPLLADVQTGLLYPPNWLFYLLAQEGHYYGALMWHLMAHYWLASVFMYLLMRDMGASRLGALAGGVVFAYCGFMVAHLGHMPMVLVATWIPLALLLTRRALLTGGPMGWVWAILAGLTLALSLLAGHVQIFAYGLLAVGVLGLFLLWGRWPLPRRTWVGWLWKGMLIAGLTLAVGAAQLLPSVELSGQTARSSLSYEEASEYPAQPITLLNLVLPRVYGESPTTYSFGEYQTTENWAYCGIVTLALAAAGLILGRGRARLFFGLLTVLALLLIVGNLSILHAWLYGFAPGFNKLRDAGRALVLLGLGLGGLAGFGIDGLRATLLAREGKRREAFYYLAGLSAVIAVGALWVMPLLFGGVLQGSGALYGRLPGAINDAGMALLWLGLLAGVGWLAYRRRLGVEAMAGSMVLLLVLDLFSPNSRFNPTTQDVLAGYQHFDARSILLDGTRDTPTGIPLRMNSDTDAQGVWAPANALDMGNLYDTGGAFNPLRLERYERLWEEANRNPNTPLFDLTGAAYEVLSDTTRHQDQQKWVRIQRFQGFQLFWNQNAMPRAFIVHESVIEPDPVAAVEALRRFYVDPRHAVILENGEAVTSDRPGTAEEGALSEAEWVRADGAGYGGDVVELRARAASPGWLVLTDNWYPGWEATVDGAPVPIERAYSTYRAVRIEPGEHSVVMRFSPASWRWGRILSLGALGAGFFGLGALLFLLRRKRARRGEPERDGETHHV
jgi:hypothetical protein